MVKTEELILEVKHLYKEFVLPQSKTTSLKQAAVNIVRDNKKTTQKVLNDINFTVNKGDFFGIVGRNGSGKSTLLKLIAGIYSPTKGEIMVHGGLTPFIELGVGFNPELSGRDNVFLNGALLGYTHKQMDEMYDEIVDFAELGPFMDQKLKNYSSGMQVRLAFSIAIKAKNDVLIFDEVLAVGDEAFQRKCMDIFRGYRKNKQTVILVTHSMDSVNALCTKALMLEDGKVKYIGNVSDVARMYSESNILSQQNDSSKNKAPDNSVPGLEIKGLELIYEQNSYMNLLLDWKNRDDIRGVGISIATVNNVYVFGSNFKKIKDGQRHIKHKINLNLLPGEYKLNLAIYNDKGDLSGLAQDVKRFHVRGKYDESIGGVTVLKHEYIND